MPVRRNTEGINDGFTLLVEWWLADTFAARARVKSTRVKGLWQPAALPEPDLHLIHSETRIRMRPVTFSYFPNLFRKRAKPRSLSLSLFVSRGTGEVGRVLREEASNSRC